jgi:hypothetical protein
VTGRRLPRQLPLLWSPSSSLLLPVGRKGFVNQVSVRSLIHSHIELAWKLNLKHTGLAYEAEARVRPHQRGYCEGFRYSLNTPASVAIPKVVYGTEKAMGGGAQNRNAILYQLVDRVKTIQFN